MSAPAQRLAGRLALITGASRGIGRAVAARFAAEGAHVVALARTQGALEELDDAIRAAGGQASLVPLDLRDVAKIDRLGASLHERFGRLDVLVGNAGVLGTLTPVGHLAPKTWEEVIAVNLTANWRLIRSLDPLLRQSGSGRVVFTTCAAARDSSPYWGAYAASKAALETLARIYAGEVARTGIKINLVDPGIVRSTLRAQAFPGEDRGKLAAPEDVTEPFVTAAAAECQLNGETLRVLNVPDLDLKQ